MMKTFTANRLMTRTEFNSFVWRSKGPKYGFKDITYDLVEIPLEEQRKSKCYEVTITYVVE